MPVEQVFEHKKMKITSSSGVYKTFHHNGSYLSSW